MRFTQIRSATVIIEFAGHKFLIDPMLAEKDAYPGFPGTVNNHIRFPTAPLPVPVSQLFEVDAVIATHIHPDHWDEAAARLIPKDKPIFCQSQRDAEAIRSEGFTNVSVLGEITSFGALSIHKTPGQHGGDKIVESGLWKEVLGDVCGLVFKHPDEKTLYIAGDTVWYEGVQRSIERHKPAVIVLNSCDAKVFEDQLGDMSIIMSKEDVCAVCKAAPEATVIASHMEAVNHATLTRAQLSAHLSEAGLREQVRIPADGEAYTF